MTITTTGVTGTLTNTSGTIDANGNVSLGGAVDNDATLKVGGTLGVTADGINNSGTLTTTDAVTVDAGGLNNSGTVAASAGVTVTVGGLINSNDFDGTTVTVTAGELNNSGDFDATGLVTVTTDNLVNTSTFDAVGITITAGDLQNSGTLTSTGAVIVGGVLTNSAGTLTVDDGATGTAVNLDIAGLLTNGGIIAVDGDLDATGVTNSAGSISVGGDLDARGAAFDNAEGASVNVTGLLTVDDATSSNAGSLISGSFTNTNIFTNTGDAKLGQITNDSSNGSFVNSKTLSIDSGSDMGTGDFNTAGGSVDIEMEALNNTGLTTTGDIFVDADSVLTISVKDSLLESAGSQVGATILAAGGDLKFIASDENAGMADAIDLTEGSAETFSVSSGSILLDVSNVNRTADGVTADLSINSAGDVVEGIGANDATVDLANDFQKIDTEGEQFIADVYGSLVEIRAAPPNSPTS